MEIGLREIVFGLGLREIPEESIVFRVERVYRLPSRGKPGLCGRSRRCSTQGSTGDMIHRVGLGREQTLWGE